MDMAVILNKLLLLHHFITLIETLCNFNDSLKKENCKTYRDDLHYLQCHSVLWTNCSIFWESYTSGEEGGFIQKKYNGSKDEYMSFEPRGEKIPATASLKSPWLPPAGVNCTLQFSANSESNLKVFIEENIKSSPKKLKFVKINSTLGNWPRFESTIGRVTRNYKLIWLASIHNKHDFAGIDDIDLISCDVDGSHLEPCPFPHYRCKENGLCQSYNKVCNLKADCLLGDDEHDCDDMPDSVRCKFRNNFCGWTHYSTDGASTAKIEKSDLIGPSLSFKQGRFVSPPLPSTINQYELDCTMSFGFENNNTDAQLQLHQKSLKTRCQRTDRCQDYRPSLTCPKASCIKKCNGKMFCLNRTEGCNICDSGKDMIHLWPTARNHTPFVTIRSSTTFWLEFNIFPKEARYPIRLTHIMFNPLCFGKVHNDKEHLDKEKMKKVLMTSKNHNFRFRTCGAIGSRGPNQNQCDSAYKSKGFKVKVTSNNEKITPGIQLWTVNKTDTYTINAVGAFGGRSINIKDQFQPTFVSVNCNLTADEQLFILVGQRGDGAYCRESHELKGNAKKICEAYKAGNESSIVGGGGGGGGGGGASYVFKKFNGILIPLVVAGGAAGRGLVESEESIKHLRTHHPNINLINKAGGSPCQKSLKAGWKTYGGFGGGEGGCEKGGRGGYNGQFYINTDFCANDTLSVFKDPSHTEEDGMVEVVEYLRCPEECETCMLVYRQNGSTCLDCFRAGERMSDKVPCSGLKRKPKQIKENENQMGRILKIAVAPFCALLIIAFSIFLLYRRRLKKERAIIANIPLNRLQAGNLAGAINTINPNYAFNNWDSSRLVELPRDRLTLIQSIGKGAFGEVYMGYLIFDEETPEIAVAVKTLSAMPAQSSERDFTLEAIIMSQFDHENIVKLIGVCFQSNPRYIILELLEGGDMQTFLRENRPKTNASSQLTLYDLMQLAHNVASGCQYLENRHFVHRDVAARNCLLTTKDVDRIAKIADFGMARDIYHNDYYRKGGSAVLPVKWMPPEAFLDGIFSSKTDVWSFGIVLWEIFSLGFSPYPGKSNQEVMHVVRGGIRLDAPEHCPPSAYSLMKNCWDPDPKLRPSFEDILKSLNEIISKNKELLYSQITVKTKNLHSRTLLPVDSHEQTQRLLERNYVNENRTNEELEEMGIFE
ncbi:DgyrCDS11492 [Dimorphilus gyrociliatus]|uniref:Tyrosine-protein kinase receptor n=1 Tax=Dimorphilus gyrociliatus TaxID=2664684 RepID=A0A7I8W4F4_9ANNE|nr:DgyrCDS11492 [Dimorphilus gyrociliatus]